MDLSAEYNVSAHAALVDAPETSPEPITDFAVTFYRQGRSLEQAGPQSEWLSCPVLPPGPPDSSWTKADWRSAGHSFPIPSSWCSGVYIAILTGRYWSSEQNGYVILQPRIIADGRAAKLLFVLLPASTSTAGILYKIPVHTYHAYNYEGGGSFYSDPALDEEGLPRVTLQRPGGGTGGIISPSDYACPDYYERSSPRQTFAHWDAPFISWLESQGDPVDYCTDCDIDADANCQLSGKYNLLLSAGHDEYWSDGMRDNAERFIGNGGNVAFFGGNTCWWRVAYGASPATITCDKTHYVRSNPDRGGVFAGTWWGYGRPENLLTGVSYRAGGGRWSGSRQQLGYTVQHANHWVFEGTGLRDGDVFGTEEALVGYECDGAQLVQGSPGQGMVPSGIDRTPPGFIVLGYAGPLDESWQDLQANELSLAQTGSHYATLGLYSGPGLVLTASTTDWPRALRCDAHVQTITRNVIKRLQEWLNQEEYERASSPW